MSRMRLASLQNFKSLSVFLTPIFLLRLKLTCQKLFEVARPSRVAERTQVTLKHLMEGPFVLLKLDATAGA